MRSERIETHVNRPLAAPIAIAIQRRCSCRRFEAGMPRAASLARGPSWFPERSASNLAPGLEAHGVDSGGLRVATLALGLLLIAAAAGENFVDPDAFHLMALFRDALHLGWIPLRDRFAYTPTVYPCVQHEWGTGALLYLATSACGASGLLALKYALVLGIAIVLFRLQRRAGAPVAVFAPLAPIGIVLVATGFSTVRAQVFTLLGVALLLLAVDCDRRGERGWILPWLGVHLVWLNLHAGFAAGFLLFLLHVLEQRLRGAHVRHLLWTATAMAALVLVNPYGWRYVPALVRGLALDRAIVTEWDPVWREAPAVIAVFGGSLLLALYALLRRGRRGAHGVLLVLASAVAAILHQRHVSIYAVVWLGLVPGWTAETPLGLELERAWRAWPAFAAATAAVVALFSACAIATREPWRLRVPADREDSGRLAYPAGAVRYLEERGFRGNLMVPFTVGGFVSWKLHPHVSVSCDGRFEVAYPPRAAGENRDFYAAREGWRAILEKDPTDAVLALSGSAVATALANARDWALDYQDDVFVVFARPRLGLPAVDRRGDRIGAAFP